MKKSIKSGNNLLGIIVVWAALVLPFFASCHPLKCIDGKYRVSSTIMLVTSDIQDKEAFYDSCIHKLIVIRDGKIFLPNNCFFEHKATGIISNEFTKLTVKKFEDSIDNSGKLTSILKLGSKSEINIHSIQVKINPSEIDTLRLIIVDSKMIALLYDPYLMILEHSK